MVCLLDMTIWLLSRVIPVCLPGCEMHMTATTKTSWGSQVLGRQQFSSSSTFAGRSTEHLQHTVRQRYWKTNQKVTWKARIAGLLLNYQDMSGPDRNKSIIQIKQNQKDPGNIGSYVDLSTTREIAQILSISISWHEFQQIKDIKEWNGMDKQRLREGALTKLGLSLMGLDCHNPHQGISFACFTPVFHFKTRPDKSTMLSVTQ